MLKVSRLIRERSNFESKIQQSSQHQKSPINGATYNIDYYIQSQSPFIYINSTTTKLSRKNKYVPF